MIFSRVIFWKEGGPLEPHLFQLSEILARSELYGAAEGLAPWPWGFASLELDDEALDEGTLAVREMDLALPGGFRLTVPGNARVDPARASLTGADGEIAAYLGVPVFSHVGPNVDQLTWEIRGAAPAALRAAEAGLGGEPVRYPRYQDLDRITAALAAEGRAGSRGGGESDASGGPGFAPPRDPGHALALGLAEFGGGEVARELPSGPSLAGRGRLMRSLEDPSAVRDMHAGGPDAWVHALTYQPGLMFGQRDADSRGLFLVPVARLQRSGGRLSRLPFAPPAVRLYQDGLLRDTALDVLELLRAKGRELEEYKLPPGRERASESSLAERSLAVALAVVARHIARLHHLLAAEAHPYAAHSELLELASELGLFAPAGAARAFPVYDHSDPGPGFAALRAAVAGLLEEVSSGPELNLVFRREGPGSFTCDLPALTGGELGFWLGARTDLPAEEAKLAVPQKARLASPARLEALAALGLPGVGLTPVREAPAGLRRRRDTAYFAIRSQDPLWEEALREGRLEVRWDDAPEKAQLMLVAVRS
ncbi:MAG: type VI secretion system baseplate subunit TssK [Deltaproteobacteria bacterium]|jgi:type VI secretion system ImpJ/VasE family protein|nr:type VI secretion system baseplate subunit TssK [Deltaproteobacteria bacterium]